MTIVRVGATKKYSDGWESAFSKRKSKGSAAPAAKKGTAPPAKKAAVKPSAKKKATGKKSKK